MSETRFKFSGRATGVDPEGYYFPRWDRAQNVSVVAASRPEANRKVGQLLGTHPRFGSWRSPGSGWGIKWDSIEEVSDVQ